MKAIVCEEYGPPDLLQLRDVAKPIPTDDEVLVKVHATSLNAADFENMRGMWSARFGGPFKPAHKILGTDLAGRVEAVGGNVSQFQPGDDVWGDLSFPYGFGTFAEYVVCFRRGVGAETGEHDIRGICDLPSSGNHRPSESPRQGKDPARPQGS